MLNATTTCAGTDALGVINQTCSTTYAESSSTDQTFYNGFTAGEIVTNVQLFLLISVGMVIAYHILFRTIKIKNRKHK